MRDEIKNALSLSTSLILSLSLSFFFSCQFPNPQPVHGDNPSNHCLVTLISQKMGIKTKARIPFLPPPICILFCNTEARRHRYQATSHGGTTTMQRTQGKGCAVLHAKAEKKAKKGPCCCCCCSQQECDISVDTAAFIYGKKTSSSTTTSRWWSVEGKKNKTGDLSK